MSIVIKYTIGNRAYTFWPMFQKRKGKVKEGVHYKLERLWRIEWVGRLSSGHRHDGETLWRSIASALFPRVSHQSSVWAPGCAHHHTVGKCESEHQCGALISPLCFTITQTPALQNALVQKMVFKCAPASQAHRLCLSGMCYFAQRIHRNKNTHNLKWLYRWLDIRSNRST